MSADRKKSRTCELPAANKNDSWSSSSDVQSTQLPLVRKKVGSQPAPFAMQNATRCLLEGGIGSSNWLMIGARWQTIYFRRMLSSSLTKQGFTAALLTTAAQFLFRSETSPSEGIKTEINLVTGAHPACPPVCVSKIGMFIFGVKNRRDSASTKLTVHLC